MPPAARSASSTSWATGSRKRYARVFAAAHAFCALPRAAEEAVAIARSARGAGRAMGRAPMAEPGISLHLHPESHVLTEDVAPFPD